MLLAAMNLTDLAVVFRDVAAGVAALWAVVTYWHNTRLERARWALSLYEKFYEKKQLKKTRDILDCEADLEQIDEVFSKGEADFADYLNFFEFVALLQHNKQLQDEEVEYLFGYYLDCLKRHKRVRAYVKEQGYEKLEELLEKRKERLFIYGTLLPEYASGKIANTISRLSWVGEAYVPGRLYDLGKYPGAVLDSSAETKVFGRVYELPNDANTLRALDSHEEFYPNDLSKSLFVRKQAAVILTDGERVRCWVYVYNQDLGGAKLIEDGRYKNP